MVKKLLALVCSIVLCLSVFNVAQACPDGQECEFKLQGPFEEYRNLGNGYHKMCYAFVRICIHCGQNNGTTYGNCFPPELHTPSTRITDVHVGENHVFFRTCVYCNAMCDVYTVPCPGGDNHVTHP